LSKHFHLEEKLAKRRESKLPLTWAETNMENNPELSAKEVKELQAKTVAAKDGQKAAFKKQRMEQFAKSKEEPKGPGRPPALKKPDDSKILPKTKGTKRIHSDKKDEELDSEEELSEDESALSDKDSETEATGAMPAKKTKRVEPTKKITKRPVRDSKTAEPAVKGKIRKEVKKDTAKKTSAAVMLGYLSAQEIANKEMKVSEKKPAGKDETSKSTKSSSSREVLQKTGAKDLEKKKERKDGKKDESANLSLKEPEKKKAKITEEQKKNNTAKVSRKEETEERKKKEAERKMEQMEDQKKQKEAQKKEKKHHDSNKGDEKVKVAKAAKGRSNDSNAKTSAAKAIMSMGYVVGKLGKPKVKGSEKVAPAMDGSRHIPGSASGHGERNGKKIAGDAVEKPLRPVKPSVVAEPKAVSKLKAAAEEIKEASDAESDTTLEFGQAGRDKETNQDGQQEEVERESEQEKDESEQEKDESEQEKDESEQEKEEDQALPTAVP